MNTLCLSFLILSGLQEHQHPSEIVHTLKNRITHQWNQQQLDPVLRFDDPSCTYQGTYFFNEDALVMSADHEKWRGRSEFSFTDILEGRGLSFAPAKRFSAGVAARTTHTSTSSAHTPRWIPWALALAGLATTTYLLWDRERHIHQLKLHF